jgi:hypothetical protein
VVKFSQSTGLTIGKNGFKGSMRAVGSSSQPVVFTSASETPQPGDWKGITISFGTYETNTVLKYCVVTFGGCSYQSDTGLVTSSVNVELTQNGSVEIQNCNILLSSGDGIRCYDSTPVIRNCIIGYNNGYGISKAYGSSRFPAISYNDLWNNTGSGYYQVSPGTGDISGDPLFNAIDTGDWRVKPESPCIDAGDPSMFDPGTNSRIDIGACGIVPGLTDLPPAAVTNLRAYDTMNDNGGSITVAWTKSEDDGGGDNDVAGYGILRMEEENPIWVTVGSVGNGIEMFTDRASIDGVSYYYVVSVRDGTSTTICGEVGPVQSLDDLPPDLPTGLNTVAGDTLAYLSWLGDITGEVAGYRIYRNGWVKPLNVDLVVAAGFTDIGLTNGKSYTYQVTAVDGAGNESKYSVTVVCIPAGGTGW